MTSYVQDFDPTPMPDRSDRNAPTIDLNFRMMNQSIRFNSNRITKIQTELDSYKRSGGGGGSISGANPSATIGLSAVNGVATTYMRSDAAPALSQAIAPTWSALHTFTLAPKVTAFAGGGSQMVVTNNVGQLSVQAIPGSASGANPSATIGLSAVNGSASTFLRSDGAPALSQAIVPTWTGVHTFSTGIKPTYINSGSVTYLTKDRFAGLVPFSSGDWTSSSVTFSSSSILQVSSGGVAHYAYRTYSGYNVAGKGFYLKYKFTYQSSGTMPVFGISSATNFVNPGAIRATGANTLSVNQPGGGSVTSGFTSFTWTVGTAYVCEVSYALSTTSNNVVTWKIWNSTETTLLHSGSVNISGSIAGTYYLGMYCSADNTTGELVNVITYGMDTDTGSGTLTGNTTFVFNESTGCLGVGTSTPTYTVDVGGSLRASGKVNLPGQTASRAVFTDASSNLTTNAITGTGNVVMSASPTLTGTITAAAANFSGLVSTPASTTTTAGLRVPHGSAPTTPVNGDIWTTTAGIFVRINGATVGPLT